MVDNTNQLRSTGHDVMTATLQGAVIRLRPG
jgi:multidrug efflux pump subunit AcrB